ncbi:hybrid sensor histidine kinase/response regulator [Aquabacterium humicola]|uniref:hybrid sensor histidine kinase/response regulator n=1 Tax=Aquabacterium humicola TaxID=3237377 RepID=UPI002542792E|nr:ATP-binding protein [Rubrivivax pictus]
MTEHDPGGPPSAPPPDTTAAERNRRANSDFLSRISHELRTPLNGVLGFAQLLQQRADELPDWTAEPLRQMRQAGDHLLTLIDDLLDLASIESGALRLQMQPLALDAVATEALQLVAPQALAAGVVLRPWAPCGAWVEADPTRLRQVLLNLLGNAIRYNRPGGDVQLRCSIPAGGATLEVQVIDSGPGIDAARRAALFQPLVRLGTEIQPAGSGLGLTIARHLAEAMGGALDIAPPAGTAGTDVRVRLRQVAPRQAAAAPALSAAAAGADRACDVLYIEDHPVNAMLVREALAMQQPCHRLRIAETGEEGLVMVGQAPPDVVLLDLNLPGADGYAVLARLRADPTTARLPCIAVSADAMPEELARARAAGFDDYWTKPLAMVGLAERIAAVAAGTAAGFPRG